MDNGKISVRYARALLSQANNERCATEVYDCLTRLTTNYVMAINAFNEVLSNPLVAVEKKLKLIHTAIGEPIHPCVVHFLEFLTVKKRENKIFLIALKYQEMYRKANNIVRADVTTATELDDVLLNKIKVFIEDGFHCIAEIHVKVDPSLIGGFTLDIEHNRMDASIKGRLENLELRIKNLELK